MKKILLSVLLVGIFAFPCLAIEAKTGGGGSSGSGISNVVEDTTPELGGALEGGNFGVNTSSDVTANSIKVTGTSGSSISTTNDQLTVQTVGGVLQVNNSSWTFNNYTQEQSTKTWTAQQILNLGAGSLNPLLTITTGTQNLVEVTGSSFTVTITSAVFQVGKFEVISPSFTVTGIPIATGYRWRGPTTNHGRLSTDGTNVTLGTDDNVPIALRSNSSNIAVFTGVSPSHIELNSYVGINTTNPSSRLDLFNGSATVRGTGGTVGLSVVGGSLTVRAHAGQGLSDPIFSVSTGTGRLFNVFATSVTASVPINASVEGASWGWDMAKSMSIDEFRSFIGSNGHLPTVPSDEKLNGGLTDLGGFMSKLLATNEMLAHYIGVLEDRIKKLEDR